MMISEDQESFDYGPRKLLQECLSQYHPQIKGEKHLLGLKSKFKIALDHLQEDYRPSEEVSCRDHEKKVIYSYLKQSLSAQGCSESLYISGVPGIGKTLCVKEVLAKIQKEYPSDFLKITYANALSMKSPIDIFRFIYYDFTGIISEPKSAMYKLTYKDELLEKGLDVQPPPVNNYQKQFWYRQPQTFKEKKKIQKMKKILVIDEVDYLRNRDEDVLYNIFDWTQKKKSHLIIISICNTMDFPELLSAKVNSRMGNQRLVFKPYSSLQIQTILNERIKNLDVFDQLAITFTCKKLVVCSSDIRKCLNVLRQAIFQFIHKEKQNKKALKDQDLKNRKISVDILSKVQDKIYRDLFVNIFSEFPPSYKIVLYFLAKHFRAQNTACTLRKLQQLASGYAKDFNQLLPTLNDLKQLGIIKINYTQIPRDNHSSSEFIDMKQLRYEHITLIVSPERIIFALLKEELSQLSKGSFRMDLNF